MQFNQGAHAAVLHSQQTVHPITGNAIDPSSACQFVINKQLMLSVVTYLSIMHVL